MAVWCAHTQLASGPAFRGPSRYTITLRARDVSGLGYLRSSRYSLPRQPELLCERR